jgi:hypothetical protein
MVTDRAAVSTRFALSVEPAVTVSGGRPRGGAAMRRNDAMSDTDWDPAGPASAASAASAPSDPAVLPSVPENPGPDPLPGRVWGIVSLALSVLPLLQLVGLVAGVVGLALSLRAGRRNWFAVAGIAVSLLLLIAAGAFAVLFAFSGYDIFGGSVGSVVEVCSELGRGRHLVDGLTYTCD